MTMLIVIGVSAILALAIIGMVFWWHGGTKGSVEGASVTIRDAVFTVTVASTPAQRNKGLSGHAALEGNEGMLFVFSPPSQQYFWMKGMLFSIDIIWIKDGIVIGIERNIPVPATALDTMKTYASPGEVSHVLEATGGTADRLDMIIGDKVAISI